MLTRLMVTRYGRNTRGRHPAGRDQPPTLVRTSAEVAWPVEPVGAAHTHAGTTLLDGLPTNRFPSAAIAPRRR